jgi:hypothetical protein
MDYKVGSLTVQMHITFAKVLQAAFLHDFWCRRRLAGKLTSVKKSIASGNAQSEFKRSFDSGVELMQLGTPIIKSTNHQINK